LSARALVTAALSGTPYLDRVLELLESSERGDPECRVALMERHQSTTGVALYGPVAGARDTWHIMALTLSPGVDPRIAGKSLVNDVVDAVRAASGRLIVAELPADPVMGNSLTALRASGFRQEGRIPDYFRDGIALLFLRRDL
jgi:hypothetical protein